MGSEKVAVNVDAAGAVMEPWKKTPDSIAMIKLGPELSLGLKRLDSVAKVTIDVGKPSMPRGRYTVTSSEDLVVFKSTEFTSESMLTYKIKRWEFQVHLLDPANYQVISLWRHFMSDGSTKMEVRVCGVLVALVTHTLNQSNDMLVGDATGKTVLKIKIPIPDSFRGTCVIDLKTSKDEKIGSISKLCSPSVTQVFGDYNITFPEDMDVKYKAAVLGACILIDFMSFEKKVQ